MLEAFGIDIRKSLKLFWKKFIVFGINFIYLNSRFSLLNVVAVVIYFFGQHYGGLIFWIVFILQVLYFLWLLWKNFNYQRSSFKILDLIWDSPLSVIIGKLGTGKTLFLTYLNKFMHLKADNKYTNYPIQDKNTKIINFNHLDFKNKKKLMPEQNSFIGIDEFYLYMDGTNPKNLKEKHGGKIPWILLARHFGHRAVFTAQREGMVWNEIRNLATAFIIPVSLNKPRGRSELFSFIPKSFILQFAVFQDLDDYHAWREESVKGLAQGKRVKYKSNGAIGVQFFKIVIPLSVATSYDSKWLASVRDLRNDFVKDKKETYWSELKNMSLEDKLKELGIERLLENLDLD